MSKLFQKGYTNLLIPLILILGLIAALYLVSKPANILPKAYDTSPIDLSSKESDIIVSSNGKFGIAINLQKIEIAGKEYERVPNINQLLTLSPGWVRFEYRAGDKIPDFPKDIKTLIIFNHLSVPGDSVGKTNFLEWSKTADWSKYTDEYVTALENVIKKNPGKIDAIEVWNEEDICHDAFCAKVPENIYAQMLKRSAAIIKQLNPDIKVIMGGLVTNDIVWEDGGYLTKVIQADPDVFDQVDALGLHPYGKTINNWCSCNSYQDKTDSEGNKNPNYCTYNIDPVTKKESCTEALPYGFLKTSIEKYKAVLPSHVKIWITEIGIGTYDNAWQKDYMKMIFDYLHTETEVIIWYAWIDTMTGGNGENNWGLYDEWGNIKLAGELFKTYSSP